MSRRSRAEPEETAAWKSGDKAWVRYDKPFECELVARRGGKYGEWTVRWENGDVEPKSVPERLLLRTGPDSEDVSDSSKASSPEQPKEAPRALTRRRPSKPSDADISHANEVGEQIWLKVLESETKKRSAFTTCKTYSKNPVPLDLAKVDELLESCSPDVLPLETTAFRLPLHNPTIEALGLDAIQRKDMEALRFSSRAADRPPYFDAEIDHFEGEQREKMLRRKNLASQTFVEWLCSKDDHSPRGEVDADWVFETLRALMERGAMVTENALAAAERVRYNRGHPVVESNLELKVKLLVYMLSQCPGIITMTRRNLDYYAKIVDETHEESGEHFVAFDVLERLTDSPDVYDAFAAYPWGSPEREAAPQRLSKLLRSNAALRPPPIEPEVGVTHAAGGHFSRWHEKHVKFMKKKVEELKDEAVAEEIAALKSECERVSAELARVQGQADASLREKASLERRLSRYEGTMDVTEDGGDAPPVENKLRAELDRETKKKLVKVKEEKADAEGALDRTDAIAAEASVAAASERERADDQGTNAMYLHTQKSELQRLVSDAANALLDSDADVPTKEVDDDATPFYYMLESHRDDGKQTVLWNVEADRAMTLAEGIAWIQNNRPNKRQRRR